MIKRIVAWAIDRSAAMNTLMLAIILAGLFSFGVMRRESFPEFELEIILVSVPYPGAAPAVTEESICQKLESAIHPIAGIKQLTSVAAEGVGYAIVEIYPGEDAQKILNEIRGAVDRIPSLPQLAENKDVRQITMRNPAIRVGVLGPQSVSGIEAELELRNLTEEIRQELLVQKPLAKSGLQGLFDFFTVNPEQPVVTQADILGAKPYQIDVEIREQDLRKYNLSLKQVAQILRQENIDIPGGILRSEVGDVSLQAKNKGVTGEEIAELPLLRTNGEVVLKVKDIANVYDGFADVDSIDDVNGHPANVISVMRSPSEDILRIADAVHQYVEERNQTMPPGYKLEVWFDQSVYVEERMDLLMTNGLQGLLLVFFVLALFLELRLAFWVAMGIPISVLGAGIVLIYMGQTINMISMFAFLLALGIVVDDAIVVGENIYRYQEKGLKPLQAAIEGTAEVFPAVSASVSTTIIAFAPLLFIAGIMGKFFAVMPAAVIAMLAISLFECVLILPAHLGHESGRIESVIRWILTPFRPLLWLIQKANQGASWCLHKVIHQLYMPSLRISLKFPLIPISVATALLVITLVVVARGVIPFVFFPKMDSFVLSAKVVFPDGTPSSVPDAATKELEAVALQLKKEVSPERELYKVVHRAVGHATGLASDGVSSGEAGSFIGVVDIELVDSSERRYTSQELISKWRELAPEFPDAESLVFTEGGGPGGPGGKSIEFKLLAPTKKMAELEAAAADCVAFLNAKPGVADVEDDIQIGKEEYRFKIKEDAQVMGISTAQLADAVRGAFYGEEVMRLQRGRHEVKLMVRYPEEQRRRLLSLSDVRVRGNDKAERPISEVAEITKVREFAELNRVNQLRSITITGDVDRTQGVTSNMIYHADIGDGKKSFMDYYNQDIKEKYPNVYIKFEGQAQQQKESIDSMITGFIVAMLVIFFVLTLQFKSYLQPFLIMSIIPFGLIGAVWGHFFMGLEVTLFSLCGIVALMGVVINDSIVLIDYINKHGKRDEDILTTLVESGRDRFRPVLLTSITTVAGLLPLLLETSFQAQVLIPMATSLCFGLILGTVLILYLVPTFYVLYYKLTKMFSDKSYALDTDVADLSIPP
ncbi:efflux RND transporter permease subunit [Pirellulaceae bacterium]|nr:efflux RND transporter permease subunit [Pirellulaceae bacterium]